MKKFFLILILFLIIAGFLMPTRQADAALIYLMEHVSDSCMNSGDCSVCDILRVVYNVGRLIFSAMAGIALIFLIWAGIGLIFNMGNPEAVAASKKLILHTLLAVLIIMAAYILVNLLLGVLTGTPTGQAFKWQDGRPWFQGPVCK